MPITLDLPEEIETRLGAMSEEERRIVLQQVNDFAVAALIHQETPTAVESARPEQETPQEEQERLRTTLLTLMGKGRIINPPPPGKVWSEMEGFD